MNLKRFASRRAFLAGSLSLLLSGLLFRVKAQNNTPNDAASGKSITQGNARLGINFDGINDWTTEQPFVDFFRSSRNWISQSKSGWGAGPALLLDDYGWVKALASGCRATRIISTAGKGLIPNGDYTVLFDGEGELRPINNIARVVKSEPGRMVLKVNASASSDMFALDLISTNPKNYMRNIRLIAPGFEANYQKNPWNPEFLKRWAGVACVRMMDLMATNNSSQSSWKNRPTLQDAGFTSKGVPVELLVDLANRLETDAWVCIPHKADDEYVQQLMTYFKANLAPNSKVWVEYSNEIWNSMFEQSRYAGELGQQMQFSDRPWEAAWKYTAHRSIEIFKIVDDVYAGRPGAVKVLASHAANAFVSEVVVSFKHAAKFADVLAIAPYVSFNVTPDAVDKISKWDLDQLFDYLNKTSIPESTKWIQDSKKVADKYGLMLVAYEAGQHLVGVGGSENNDKLTQLLTTANADKRMGEIYEKNLAAWEKAGGDLMCTYSSMTAWAKWGSWGLLRNNQENPKESPKFSTVIKWAISRGQKMSL